MLDRINLAHILFLDIETVPQERAFSMLDPAVQELYEEKTRYQRKGEIPAEEFYAQAGIWAEFGRIVCLSVGYFTYKMGDRQFRTTSFVGEEVEILQAFANLLNAHFNRAEHLLCGHNAKEFDFPYIARRMIIHGLKVPAKLNLMGKKPWEVPHLDTMEMWKFGDYKHYTSLKLLAHILQIPSPKDDIHGADVARVYYEDQDLDRIMRYCEKDVITVAQIVLRLRGEAILEPDELLSV
ncbi:3'-5' exonuclease [Myroides sp. NP-2]|uniref:3'-5' exonuclease n=1 Tax=Myroides sp. NP-2 TaxID=2759945 RepID=UPI0015FD8E45|nr:3'-5' exonuclease [Myroides sp. NP-2]MBB1150577.1 3'-5' exonuclease [Myroides sp. NP-2]